MESADQVIVLDETHKDKNSSRRRRAWGQRNSKGLALRKWFRRKFWYTMIAAMDITGFIDSTIDLILRDEVGEDGASGTVDSEQFEGWVENHLCPVLGLFANNEPRSIVIMDNARVHMSDRVRELIEGARAYLLYTAPHSPDLSPN